MADLVPHLRRCFSFAADAAGEYSIEIDPRTVDAARAFTAFSGNSTGSTSACRMPIPRCRYSRNEKTLDSYYERIERGELPIARGIKLNTDDVLRRIIIQMLMCHFELSIASLELAYPINFASYFEAELKDLRSLEADGLLSIDQEWITVTPKGRLLIRNICMVFDRYLNKTNEVKLQRLRYSRTI